jgi:hypothetical protein
MIRFWIIRGMTVTEAGVRTVLSPYVALIRVVVAATPVTRPAASPLFATVATVESLDVKVLRVVTSWTVPSLKVAFTVKGVLVPAVKARFVVEKAIVASGELVTVRLVVADREPDVAVTVVVGVTASGFNQARLPPARITFASEESATVQVTAPVMSRLLPLLNVPIAVKRPTVSLARILVRGESAIPVRFPPVVVRSVVWATLPRVALILVVPCVSADIVPSAAIVAISALDELQAT